MLSIYNKISDYILVLNFDGEVIFCNESLLNRLNYSMDEVLNFNMSKLINNINTKANKNNILWICWKIF
ncbi:hypothetical protein QX51_01650 [Terrisporobacter othiniensis]|uniref:PAS domain-containing protein n=1 Tax=Terrisporobacter othiniensis TaxID=1577792 RepID=A0A0B3VPC2_9FIRM|nr:PAS domain-containing protein [Terrisporobacter othiniensis]KHS58636.1 hypothetical protein QX51_01650 [Terrisporobacter othiniensis]